MSKQVSVTFNSNLSFTTTLTSTGVISNDSGADLQDLIDARVQYYTDKIKEELGLDEAVAHTELTSWSPI